MHVAQNGNMLGGTDNAFRWWVLMNERIFLTNASSRSMYLQICCSSVCTGKFVDEWVLSAYKYILSI